MIKIKFLLTIALTSAIMLSSCEKSSLEPDLDPPVEEEDTIEEDTINLIFTIKKLDNDETNDKEGHKKYNFLGFGYDVTGKYAHASSVRAAVINIPEFVTAYPNRFVTTRTLSSTFREIYTANAEQFTKELTNIFFKQQESHNSTYFKGSITHSFPETDVNSNEYVYGLYELDIRDRKLSLNASDQLLAPHVTEDFQYDCLSLEAAEIIEKYGTHMLTSLYMGAKLSVNYQAGYTGKQGQQASEDSFKVGLLTYFELPPSIFPPHDFNSIKGISNPVIAMEAIGGDPSKIRMDPTSKNTKIKTAAWRESITEENARFVYLDGFDKLLPISDLIANEEKKQEVKNYIHEYIKVNEVKVD